jgi:hypothetical protein
MNAAGAVWMRSVVGVRTARLAGMRCEVVLKKKINK